MDRFEEVHLIDLFDSHTTVTHFALRPRPDSDAIRPNPILVHMARPTLSHWPLSEMEDFLYGIAEEDKLQDEAALKMLQDRYGSSDLTSRDCSGGPSHEMLRPKSLRRVRIAAYDGEDSYMVGEVRKILPRTDIPPYTDDSSLWYSST
ncbi:hypothetical protein M407DRAFT_241119 [Tulasnella calospora MUT 4182]|uniref:Uncharacterized protein n=1 Tax=Tulasnella calospora MUT 4182 TaxID=1051891 RepID=A0A0C3LH94_9AGAM|nr:hypothetical protein M407DRAFT_241119 [Tulasnella calospora MUT 4182]